MTVTHEGNRENYRGSSSSYELVITSQQISVYRHSRVCNN